MNVSQIILGSAALTPEAYPQLSAIAPTVFTDAPGAEWQDNLRTVGAATGRAEATGGVIGGGSAGLRLGPCRTVALALLQGILPESGREGDRRGFGIKGRSQGKNKRRMRAE